MTTTLITGATSGIGYELAQQLATADHRLILIGRRQRETLDTTFFTEDRYIQADLSKPNAAQTIKSFLDTQNIQQIDLLIHNAGTGYFGDIPDQPAKSILDVITVNLTAPVQLTHALLPKIIASQGKIVFIGSVSTALPAPEYATYVTSKAALEEFASNLRIELKGDHVQVQVIHPGATQTDMHSKLGIPTDRMDTSNFPLPETVAAQIIQTIERDTPLSTIGVTNKLLRFAGKHAAGLIDFAMKRSNA